MTFFSFFGRNSTILKNKKIRFWDTILTFRGAALGTFDRVEENVVTLGTEEIGGEGNLTKTVSGVNGHVLG